MAESQIFPRARGVDELLDIKVQAYGAHGYIPSVLPVVSFAKDGYLPSGWRVVRAMIELFSLGTSTDRLLAISLIPKPNRSFRITRYHYEAYDPSLAPSGPRNRFFLLRQLDGGAQTKINIKASACGVRLLDGLEDIEFKTCVANPSQYEPEFAADKFGEEGRTLIIHQNGNVIPGATESKAVNPPAVVEGGRLESDLSVGARSAFHHEWLVDSNNATNDPCFLYVLYLIHEGPTDVEHHR